MKYYVYASDAKIDMLFAQIPQRLSKRISGELKLDFKVVSLALRPETEPATKYGKLKVVTEYLHRHESLGTVALPGKYIEGIESMKWTTVGTTAVWLAQRRTVILFLSGAAHHLTGNAPRPGELALDSFSHMAVNMVAKELAKIARRDDLNEQPTIDEDDIANVGFIATSLYGKKQSFEFIAIRQGDEDVRGRSWGKFAQNTMQGVDRLLLASPLYVALP
jgi:hypothetical protein